MGIRKWGGWTGDGGAERLHGEGVLDDLLRLFVQLRVDERHVVVARNHVAQCGQSLLYPLHLWGG